MGACRNNIVATDPLFSCIIVMRHWKVIDITLGISPEMYLSKQLETSRYLTSSVPFITNTRVFNMNILSASKDHR